MDLTDEQRLVVASNSEALRVIAFAGAGKTSTLRAYAEARPEMHFLFLAFNRAIKQEAATKFPKNVSCFTTHGLAYGSVGSSFKHKLVNSVRANQATKALGFDGGIKGIIRGRLALNALTHFLASPYNGFDEFREAVVDEDHTEYAVEDAKKLWEAMVDPRNTEMPMLHDGYLKLYQLSGPRLNYDCILFDEAQDANPVTLEIVRNQECRKIFVGDPHQQIYQFRRATNAMDDPLLTDTLYLTQSFRFGRHIATTANAILAMKRERNLVKGGRTSPNSDSSAFLARGNAAIFTKAASLATAGKGVHFVGGIEGYRLDLLLDVWCLWRGHRQAIRDPLIQHFKSYSDLAQYAESQRERDLMAWVNLIKKHPKPLDIPKEVTEVKKLSLEKPAQNQLCVATVHKSKGLEFGTVEIAEDFPKPKLIDLPNEKNFNPDHWQYGPRRCPWLWEGGHFKGAIVFPTEEINLRYVAATRAEKNLNDSAWSGPDLSEILRYINRYPSFMLLDGESEFVKGDNQSANESGAVTQINPLQKVQIDGYVWNTSVRTTERLRKAVADFRSLWPQWSWEWFACEAATAATRNEDPATVLAAMAEKAGMSVSNPALRNFLVVCGILKKGGQTPVPSPHPPAEGVQMTLPELVYKLHGASVSHRIERFNGKGWFPVGRTEAGCPRCGHLLEGFRRPYVNSKGDLYHYWGLYCADCNNLHEPADLSSVSQKKLKSKTIPLNTAQIPEVVKDSLNNE